MKLEISPKWLSLIIQLSQNTLLEDFCHNPRKIIAPADTDDSLYNKDSHGHLFGCADYNALPWFLIDYSSALSISTLQSLM